MDLRFKWFGCQLIWDSNGCQPIWDPQVSWLSMDLRFKWFDCQSMCDSIDFVCQLVWDSSDSVVNWFEIQVIRLSIDLRFKWFGCQMVWGSSDLVVNWCVIQMILSNETFLRDFLQKDGLKLKKNEPFLRDFLQNWSLETQKRSFLRDFLQNRSFEDEKWSFSARLPSKLKLWNSKTKHFCETSFKNKALKIKNEAFLRDFLQKWRFEAQKRSFCARLPSKMTCWLDTWPQNSNTF